MKRTTPLWFEVGCPPVQRIEDARFFIRSIDDALAWVGRKGRFAKEDQRHAVSELFRKGQKEFERMRMGG